MDLNIIYRFKKHYEEAQQKANKTGDIEDIKEAYNKLENLNRALGVLKYDCENLAKRVKEEYKEKIDEKEKEIRERRAEKKRLKVVRKRELDRIFYEHWIEKIKVFKNLMPETENLSEGRGKERKFRTYFRHQTTLFLQEIKNLNIGGGK